MLIEGKSTQYLKYAIGEILLVVIGILIALSINNWNNLSKRNELEQVLLADVRDEIGKVYQDAVSDIKTLEFGLRSHGRILNYIQKDLQYTDSMSLDFFWLTRDEYVYPKEAVYSKIKQEGIDIISNDSIKYLLQDLYESQFPRITLNNTYYQNLEHFFTPYYQDNFIPNMEASKIDSIKTPRGMMIMPGKIEDMDGNLIAYNFGYIPKNFEQLKKDDKFLMLLDQSFRARNFKIKRYNSTIAEIEKVNQLIAQELKDN